MMNSLTYPPLITCAPDCSQRLFFPSVHGLTPHNTHASCILQPHFSPGVGHWQESPLHRRKSQQSLCLYAVVAQHCGRDVGIPVRGQKICIGTSTPFLLRAPASRSLTFTRSLSLYRLVVVFPRSGAFRNRSASIWVRKAVTCRPRPVPSIRPAKRLCANRSTATCLKSTTTNSSSPLVCVGVRVTS